MEPYYESLRFLIGNTSITAVIRTSGLCPGIVEMDAFFYLFSHLTCNLGMTYSFLHGSFPFHAL